MKANIFGLLGAGLGGLVVLAVWLPLVCAAVEALFSDDADIFSRIAIWVGAILITGILLEAWPRMKRVIKDAWEGK